jgi:Protein of unknown function (DUF1439)
MIRIKIAHVFALTSLVLLSACATMTEKTVTVTEAQLQQKLQAKLLAPITILKIFNVSLTQPIIKLDGQSERMTASVDAMISNPLSRTVNGKAAISGKLRFDPVTQSILLTEARIDALNIDGMGGRYSELISVLSQQLGADLLNDLPLYTLKPEDLKVAGITFVPKLMRVTQQGLQVTLAPK